MFFAETTPDTFGYMLLGYAFFIGLPLLYIASLLLRRRNLQKDREVFQMLEEEKK